MSIYLLLKNLHVVLALISVVGFGVRGHMRLVMNRPLAHPFARVGPHVIDTLLFLSGIALWIQMQFSLLSWFGVKLLMVLAYIGLGIAAFRSRERRTGIILFLFALLMFVGTAAVAVYKPMI